MVNTAAAPTQPAISGTSQAGYGLLQACERTYIVYENQVIVPYLSECNHQLLVSSIHGNINGIVSGTGDLAFLPSNGMLAAVFQGIRFASYTLDGGAIDKNSKRYWGTGEVWISYDTPYRHIVIVKLDSAGVWSGFIVPSKPGLDLDTPLDRQKQLPLQEGNQFE